MIHKKSLELVSMHYHNDNESFPQSNEIMYDNYIVKSGETIESIAALFNMTPSKLCHLNKLTMRTLLVNQKLKVIKEDVNKENWNENKKDSETTENTLLKTSECLDNISILSNHESELFPLLYQNNYMKVLVKYVTDTEGVISGKLILTPVALTFTPAFKDPVVQEYGMEKFMIHLPNSKIACVSMYNDSNVMTYKRSQRMTCNHIISPSHQRPVFSASEETKECNFESPNTRKLSLIKENSVEQNEIPDSERKRSDDSDDSFHGSLQSSVQNYLCIIASPRYKKTKTIFQKEDEYWFMVPVNSTDQVLEFLLIHGQNTYDTGANDDDQCPWLDDKYDNKCKNVNSPVQKTMKRNASFTKVLSFHNMDSGSFENKGGSLLERGDSMDWEIINSDFDVLSDEQEIFDELQFTESDILNDEQAKELVDHIPSECIGAKWEKIYSTTRDGWSLKTMYRNIFDSTRNACILIIKDTEFNVFGAVCNTYLRMSSVFYGNGLTFLFRWNSKFQIFNCTLKNNYILYGDPEYFIVGSSNSKNAIRLESTLFSGITQECETFDSPPLVSTKTFQVATIEVWSFY